MKEPVFKPRSTLLASIALSSLAVAYLIFLSWGDFPEPGPALDYPLEDIAQVDNVPTSYEESARIVLALDKPRALAAAGGSVYVAARDTIGVYDENGTEKTRFSLEGTPECLAIGEDGTIYAGLRDRVIVLDAGGAPKATWDTLTERSFLTAIAVHKGDIFVADAGEEVVYRFNSEGELVTRIGEEDAARDVPGFDVPSGYLDVAVNPDGDLWVVNPGKLGLEQYRSDGSIVTSWYRPSLELDGFSGCCNPAHIAFDGEGHLITGEKGLVRVKSYEVTRGELLGLVADLSQFPGEQTLRDLTVDARGRVWVLAGDRPIVRVFTRKEQADAATP